MRPRRFLAVAASGLLALAIGIVAPSTASAAACPTGWGSLLKTSATNSTALLTGVRAGSHTCYDRVVLDVNGPVTGYDVRYVSEFRTDGEARLVPARGGAKLQIIVYAPAHDDNYGPTYTPANPTEIIPTAGKATLRQGVWLYSYEGQSTVGIGVRARLPFRVFVLSGPGSGSRVVVDIAHRW